MSDTAGPSTWSRRRSPQEDLHEDARANTQRSRRGGQEDSHRSPQGFRIFGAATTKSNGARASSSSGRSSNGKDRYDEQQEQPHSSLSQSLSKSQSSKRQGEAQPWSRGGWKVVGPRISSSSSTAAAAGGGAAADSSESRTPVASLSLLDRIAPADDQVDRRKSKTEAARASPGPSKTSGGVRERDLLKDHRRKSILDDDEGPTERQNGSEKGHVDKEGGDDEDLLRSRRWKGDRESVKDRREERETPRAKGRERDWEKGRGRGRESSRERARDRYREVSQDRGKRAAGSMNDDEDDRDRPRRREKFRRSRSRDGDRPDQGSGRSVAQDDSSPFHRRDEGRANEKRFRDDKSRSWKRRRADNGWGERGGRSVVEPSSQDEDDEFERAREERRRLKREAEEEREREERDRLVRQRERQRRREESRERREKMNDGEDEDESSLATGRRQKRDEKESQHDDDHRDRWSGRREESPRAARRQKYSPSRWRNGRDDNPRERAEKRDALHQSSWRERQQDDSERGSRGREKSSRRSQSPKEARGEWSKDRHRREAPRYDERTGNRRRRFRDRSPSPLPTPPTDDKAPIRLERKDKSRAKGAEQAQGATGEGETVSAQETESHASPEVSDDRIKEKAETAFVPSQRARADEMYERISQVGEGTYGQVFKARAEKTGVIVALKKIRMESEKDGFPVTAMREIKLLQGLRHPNVVRLHEMMLSRSSIYMVFEYLEHDLNGILSQPTIVFEHSHLKSLASQLLSGLSYLHHRSILHRDLKGSNLLLNNAGLLKLADFGLARGYTKRKRGDYTNRVVTLWYRPPELLLGATQYGAAVDVWGAGCIFLELFTRKPVLQGQDEIDQVRVVFEKLGEGADEEWPEMKTMPWYDLVVGATMSPTSSSSSTSSPSSPSLSSSTRVSAATRRRRRIESLFAKYAPSDALDVIDRLLHFDPERRATAAEALEMPYFASNEPKAEMPFKVLGAVEGEWHEYESRRARRQKGVERREEQPQHAQQQQQQPDQPPSSSRQETQVEDEDSLMIMAASDERREDREASA